MRKINTLDFQLFLLRFGSRRFFDGFDYFKWFEYPLVYNNLDLKAGERYLDIGSGKSCFPLFVLIKDNCVVHIFDDQSILKDSIAYYKETIKKMGLSNMIGKRLFVHEATEKIEYEFPDNYFDKISCIGTLEHIRNNGDSLMMKTISRILKKGGRTIVSFPYDDKNYIPEEYVKGKEGIIWFQRRYNIPEIKRRIIGPANLKVRKVIYFGERCIKLGKIGFFGKIYSKNKFSKISWLLTFFPHFFWKVYHLYEGEFRDFNEKETRKEGVGAACIILEK